jgi:hypothetical protein
MKLSLNALSNLIKNKCTSNEIDFIIYLIQRANEWGSIRGINYKEASRTIGISERDFYYILNRLEAKNIITIDWNNKIDWNITINNNIYASANDYTKGYININRVSFTTPEFMSLKGNVKLLIMLLMRSCRDNQFKISIEKLAGWINVTTISKVLEYIEALKEYFNISISNSGILTISMKKDKFVKNSESDDDRNIRHRIITFCKQFNIHYVSSDLKDLIIMFKQYNRSWRKIFYALYESTRATFLVQPKLINKIMGSLKTI